MVRARRAAQSKGHQNGRQKWFNYKNDFLRLTYFKLFSQIKRKAINNRDFSLKYVISVRGGHSESSPRAEKKTLDTPLVPTSDRTQRRHLQGSTPKNAKTGAVCPSRDRGQYYHKIEVKQSHYRPGQAPEGSRRLRLPDFKTTGT